METWIVCYVDLFENVPELYKVEADGLLDALKKALPGNAEFFDYFKEDAQPDDIYANACGSEMLIKASKLSEIKSEK